MWKNWSFSDYFAIIQLSSTLNTKIQRIGKHTNSILKDTELGRYNNNQAITHQKLRKGRGDQCSCFRMWQKIVEWETNLALFSLKYPQFSSRYLVFKATRGFPGGPDSKESACNAGYPGLIPRLGRSLGEGNSYPFQYSCLENPMDRGSWWATVHGVTKSQTQLSQ